MVVASGTSLDALRRDSSLAAVPAMFEPEAGDVLESAGAWLGQETGPGANLALELLLHRPHRRCTVRFRNGDAGSVVVKAYHSVRRATAAFDAQTDLWGQRGDHAVMRTPRPLAIVEPWAAVVMEDVGGAVVREQLLTASSDVARRLACGAGAVLTDLRSSAVPSAGRVSGATEAAALLDRVRSEPRLDADIARRVAIVATHAQSILDGWSGSPSVAHGDFTPSQLLVDDREITLVDFDRICHTDPAVDIGTFTAKLVRDAVATDRPSIAALRVPFEEAAAVAGDASLSVRSAAVEAVHLARMAVSRLVADRRDRSTDATDPATAVAMLEEAEECRRRL